eukprot:15342751-Ditylum_brightwellii.AAC.1
MATTWGQNVKPIVPIPLTRRLVASSARAIPWLVVDRRDLRSRKYCFYPNINLFFDKRFQGFEWGKELGEQVELEMERVEVLLEEGAAMDQLAD